jgi:hypothetical protein
VGSRREDADADADAGGGVRGRNVCVCLRAEGICRRDCEGGAPLQMREREARGPVQWMRLPFAGD